MSETPSSEIAASVYTDKESSRDHTGKWGLAGLVRFTGANSQEENSTYTPAPQNR